MADNVFKIVKSSLDETRLGEILDFCQRKAVRPFYSQSLIKRFLTQLSSSPDFIFDIWNQSERVAVAVLLDKVTNPSGSANLEIVGKSDRISADELFHLILSQLPENRPLQLGTHHSLSPSTSILEKYGFHPLYNTYEMKKSNVENSAVVLKREYSFERLGLEKYDEYYYVLTRAFEKNLETSIPPLEEMKSTFSKYIKTKPAGTHLLLLDGKIGGFCSVVVDTEDASRGEVHMIGVLPELRGHGFGGLLLSKAIFELANLGCEKCHLTVATGNQAALSLYQKFGFEIDQTYMSYLRK